MNDMYFSIREMLDTEGWQHIQKFLEQKIKDHKDQLLICPIDQVIIHRSAIKSYDSVILYIQEIIDKAQEELEKER